MITQNEINALIEILNRTPLTMAERIFVQAFLEKLMAACDKPKSEDDLK